MKYSDSFMKRLSILEQKAKIELNRKWRRVSIKMRKVKTIMAVVITLASTPKVLMRLVKRNILKTELEDMYLRRPRQGRCGE